MPGVLEDDAVIIEDQKEGSQLYNKGNFGYPMKGGGSELDLVEATFLLECERIEILKDGKIMSFKEMFEYSSSVHEDFDIVYLVYRDIRQRGFVVKPESGKFDLSVFPRGSTMSDSRPLYLVRAVSERTALDLSSSSEEVSQTEKKGKRLLYGVVDEEGDLTYYDMSSKNLRGRTISSEGHKPVKGHFISDRVFVFDKDGIDSLRNSGYYGKVMGSVLQLSLIESCYLMSRGELDVVFSSGESVSEKDLISIGVDTQEEFSIRLNAFRDLKERGLIVKTGFKYGTHFRVYEGSPDESHARYLVHAVPESKVVMWPEISRTVRLSGGVKKEILFCRVGKTVEYLEFKWFRP